VFILNLIKVMHLRMEEVLLDHLEEIAGEGENIIQLEDQQRLLLLYILSLKIEKK